MFINKVKIIALLSLISILMVGCNKKAEEKIKEFVAQIAEDVKVEPVNASASI